MQARVLPYRPRSSSYACLVRTGRRQSLFRQRLKIPPSKTIDYKSVLDERRNPSGRVLNDMSSVGDNGDGSYIGPFDSRTSRAK